MEPTKSSETSSVKLIHAPRETPKAKNYYWDHGESLKTVWKIVHYEVQLK